MNTIDWFRKDFIPQASDETITQLIFLYKKYYNPENLSESEKIYIKALCEKYKNTGVTL